MSTVDGIEQDQSTAEGRGQFEGMEEQTKEHVTPNSTPGYEASVESGSKDPPVIRTTPEPITVEFVPEEEEEEEEAGDELQNGVEELPPQAPSITSPTPHPSQEDGQNEGEPTLGDDQEVVVVKELTPPVPVEDKEKRLVEATELESPEPTLTEEGAATSPVASASSPVAFDQDISASALPVDSTLLSQNEASIANIEEAKSSSREDTSDKADKEWMDVLGSGQLMKKVLRKGAGKSTRPTPQSRVKVRTKATLDASGKVVDKHHELVFTVGDGDVVSALDLAVTIMEMGEVALIKTKPRFGYGEAGNPPDVPPNASLTYEVELLDVMEPVNFSGISEEELLALVDKKRMRGNELFQRKVFEAAINSYQKAADMLENYEAEHGKKGEKSAALRDMQIRCWNNLAAAQLKVELHKPALESCDKVLKEDPDNVKALFRAGKVLSLIGELDQAVAKLQKASSLNAEEKAIQLELQRALRRRDQSRAQEKQMYQRMVSGAGPSRKSKETGKQGAAPRQESFWGPWPYLAVAAVVAVVGMGVAYIMTQRGRPN